MNNKKQQKLLLISDMWGSDSWMDSYTEQLSLDFQITVYNCLELANIKNRNCSEQQLHQQYLASGIDSAVSKLLANKKAKLNILAFSIGGTIAWKAALGGLKVDNMYLISSSRLRLEKRKPQADNIKLLFGENDPLCPDRSWFKRMDIKKIQIKNAEHSFYKKKEYISFIIQKIKNP